MTQYVYSMHRVGKTVPPKRQILKDISLSFLARGEDRHSRPERRRKIDAAAHHGRRRHRDRRRSEADGQPVGRLSRTRAASSIPTKPVRETVEEGARRNLRRAQTARRSLRRVRRIRTPTSTNSPTSKPSSRRSCSPQGDDLEQQLESRPTPCGLPPWDAKIGPLSGGEKRRVALCRLLLSKPDMLLLDEPTNHLDAESVEWLEHFLQRFPGTVVAVTHDRYFLDNAAEWILELDRGRGIPWKGNYSSWLDQKQQRLAQEEAERIGAPAGAQARTGMGAFGRQGPAIQEQEPPGALRGTLELRISEPQRNAGDLHPGRRAARRSRHRVFRRAQSIRRPAAHGRRYRSASPPARSSASSAPTAPENRPCFA